MPNAEKIEGPVPASRMAESVLNFFALMQLRATVSRIVQLLRDPDVEMDRCV